MEVRVSLRPHASPHALCPVPVGFFSLIISFFFFLLFQDGADRILRTRHITALSGGWIIAGSKECPYTSKLEIILSYASKTDSPHGTGTKVMFHVKPSLFRDVPCTKQRPPLLGRFCDLISTLITTFFCSPTI